MPRIYLSSTQQDSLLSPGSGSLKTISVKQNPLNSEIVHMDTTQSGILQIIIIALLFFAAFRRGSVKAT